MDTQHSKKTFFKNLSPMSLSCTMLGDLDIYTINSDKCLFLIEGPE